MSKETLSLDNIKQDLNAVAYSTISNESDWRFSYVISFSALAVLCGIITKSIWVGLLIFAVAAYHIVFYIIAYKEYLTHKKAIRQLIKRGDISISLEKLSHIAEETVYEPWSGRRGRTHFTKLIRVYNFMSGGSWRVPDVDKHYKWSKTHYISLSGLANISVQGNEFFYISLQGYPEIAYIYPLKLFELDKSLEKNN